MLGNSFILLCLVVSSLGLEKLTSIHGHLPRNPNTPRPSYVRSSLPRGEVPEAWDWSSVGGINYLTQVKNQHIPQYCGSCWAQAATSSLSDRIKIARQAQWPDVNISPQVLISCGPLDGCHGGDAGVANQWMHNNSITDETCSIYRARGHDNGAPCEDIEICETCDPQNSVCYTPQTYLKYKVDEFGDIEGNDPVSQEENMRKEIYHRGPISCGIAVTDELYKHYKNGIFNDTTGSLSIDHDISVVGYGVDNGVKFWKIRNSWGTYWGEKGFFRLIRGTNNIGIEGGYCSWATPLKTWKKISKENKLRKIKNKIHENLRENNNFPETNTLERNANRYGSSLANKIFTLIEKFLKNSRKFSKGCRVPKMFYSNGSKVKTPEPYLLLADSELPESWDWRNVKGRNYLSWNVNQHIPQYCGSCWAQGTLSSLADRFIIADRIKYSNLGLAVQTVINCRGGGSCEGGNPGGVYEFAHDVGVPDMTCQLYEAKDNGPVDDCTKPDMYVCRDCGWPPPKLGDKGNCWVKKEFKRYYASEYGTVSGAQSMKKEIYERGPISCGIQVTDAFEKYTGGIYSEDTPEFINHEISVVGWGVENGQEYWIGRNSWGTYWGETGFFRLAMHKNNLGIENDCSWAVPDLNK